MRIKFCVCMILSICAVQSSLFAIFFFSAVNTEHFRFVGLFNFVWISLLVFANTKDFLINFNATSYHFTYPTPNHLPATFIHLISTFDKWKYLRRLVSWIKTNLFIWITSLIICVTLCVHFFSLRSLLSEYKRKHHRLNSSFVILRDMKCIANVVE